VSGRWSGFADRFIESKAFLQQSSLSPALIEVTVNRSVADESRRWVQMAPGMSPG